ncbi:MAG: hypothetical protein JSS49_18550 [Planctomycetes bacterium]|nr:hypothetical protein [Planctomycetota bacterium]
MAKDSVPHSIVDLERLLETKRDQLQDLLHRRVKAQKELESLDAQIQDSLNPNAPIGRVQRRRRRVKNESSLRTVVEGVLAKNKKGLSLSDLVTKVTETGYKSNSQNFKNVVYQCLYHSDTIVHDEVTGCYRIER